MKNTKKYRNYAGPMSDEEAERIFQGGQLIFFVKKSKQKSSPPKKSRDEESPTTK